MRITIREFLGNGIAKAPKQCGISDPIEISDNLPQSRPLQDHVPFGTVLNLNMGQEVVGNSPPDSLKESQAIRFE